jgi:hypothetical protein
MDVFESFGIDTFKSSIWIVSITVAVLLALRYPHKRPRQVVGLVLKATLGAAITFSLASLGTVFYILAHPTDQRWSVGKDAALKPPELSSGVPIFDGIVNNLNQFMGSMTGSVNDVLAIKNAFLSTTDFLLMAGWGLGAVIALGLPVWVMGIVEARWRERQLSDLIDKSTDYDKNLAGIRKAMNLPDYKPGE